MDAQSMLAWIVALPLVGAAINGLVGWRLPKRLVGLVACGTTALSFVFAVLAWMALRERLADPAGGDAIRASLWTWIDSGVIHVEFALLLDRLSAVMVLVVTGVGFLIHVFSLGYMRDDPGYARYFAYLNLFMFSMLCLVLGSNLLLLFLGWEGVGLCSYLLIGFWFTDDQKARAGQKAFVVNRIGDFGFLIGLFVLLFYTSGRNDFVALAHMFSDAGAQTAPLRDPATITFICLALFVGACGKSAQIPLYVWLPDAMAGPTPVSALIHAATMVTAGVYMVTRLNFLYTLSPVAMAVVATVGAATALMAATIGVLQRDIKKVLAYSTVSQLGYMFLAAGTGAFSAAIFHLTTHAFFKALLFLGSGAVIHALHHEQDIFRMGNLRRLLPVTHWTFLVATLAIAGVPPLSGFVSKEAILHGAAGFAAPGHDVPLAAWGLTTEAYAWLPGYFEALALVGLLAAGLTAFYMFRLYFLTFHTEYRGDPDVWSHPHTPGWAMRVPLVVLAVLAAVGGALPIADWLGPVLQRPTTWLTAAEGHHGGLTAMLMPLSIAIAATGIALAWYLYVGPGRHLPERLREGLQPLYRLVSNKYYVDEIYDWTVVRTVQGSAHLLHAVVDRVLIDRIAVHAGPTIVSVAGRALRFAQNGEVQRYAAWLVTGMAILLYLAR